jgi:TonB family protein
LISFRSFQEALKLNYQYLITTLRYPKAAYDKRLEGRTDVALIIERDGTVTGVKVRNSSGSADLDAEAMRVISESPKWVPGVQNGKTVRVAYMLPIVFSLKKS